MNEQHIYHHSNNDGPRINVKVEKNTKGYNWEVTITGAPSTTAAIALLTETETALRALYGEKTAA
jgi:hypothetical protein